MLGLEGFGVFLAYVLCIGSAALCIAYGALTWNKGDESIRPEDEQWAKKEKQSDNGLTN
ncbi:MAG TPA: hypothetical protein PKY35_06115 [Candidatus Hydrogenedentes bacterium]|nr:hypothetical protein [Candidatus Hydrogenedentota bacterium]HOL76587.1 hypothetical protein [Candidatus Hydrogenedentota bacterium]HPO84420.1 hypothetical protein [Candidatus Hydrogenedentota bacterium]